MTLACSHTNSEAMAVLFWPLLAVFIFGVLVWGMSHAQMRHQLRVSRERTRRLENRLKTWEDHT